jgi:outer membrane protein assembly factor BamB
VANGKVFFGAGDDGVYCLDAQTGKKCWRFAGPFHIDSSPAVSGRRLYLGSGISRTKRTTQCLCLDTENGKVLWRFPTNLPVWGSPVVFGEDVFFGLANGRLLTPPEPPMEPAGGVLCLMAKTGEYRWRYEAGDAVFVRVAVNTRHVYLGARNGVCSCLDRQTGRLCWKQDVGSPVVASPALVGDRLYVVASGGRVCCLDAETGGHKWTFDVAGHSRTKPQLLSSPAVVPETSEDEAARRIYFGAELRNPISSAAVLYCLRD